MTGTDYILLFFGLMLILSVALPRILRRKP